MNKGQQQLRQRKKNSKKDKGKAPTEKKEKLEPASKKKEQEVEEEKSLAQTFFEHPLIVVAPWILGPYCLYLLYFYVRLQRPDLLIPFGIQLRPAVAIDEPRQVLIIGSMSTGTVQVAHDLTRHLGLEIGHESSNSVHEFVRDGTVSWFHVIRYLEPPTRSEDAVAAYKNLCLDWVPKMGFHPAMYKPSGCSPRVQWDACWTKQCLDVLQHEWGCALSSTPHDCESPFVTTLHQRRHPLRTIESLAVKFCQGNQLDTGIVSPGFVQVSSGLFGRLHNFTDDSCVEAAAHYVLEYNKALLAAQLDFHTIQGSFAIEDTSVCEIAKLAGFMDPDKVVYPSNVERVSRVCSNEEGHSAQEPIQSTEHKRNEDIIQLTWEDFRGGKHGSKRPAGDTTLEKALKDLTKKLGYARTPDFD